MIQLFAGVICRALLELLEFQEKMVRRESVDLRAPQDQLEHLDQGYCMLQSTDVFFAVDLTDFVLLLL